MSESKPEVPPVPVVAPGLTAIEIAAVVVAVIAIVAAAWIAEAFLVPVVAGILLSYTLRPLVSVLERARLPRLAATSLVMISLVGVVSASFYAISGEFNDVVAALPTAARKLRHIAADAARSSPGPVSNMKAAAVELDRAAAEATGKIARVEAPAPSATSQIQDWIAERSGQALVMLVQISMALLLTFFLLAAGDTFRRKMARLAGESLGRRTGHCRGIGRDRHADPAVHGDTVDHERPHRRADVGGTVRCCHCPMRGCGAWPRACCTSFPMPAP